MNEKSLIFSRLKSNLVNDRMASMSSFEHVMRTEIFSAVKSCAEIDPVASKIEFDHTASGTIVKAQIFVRGAKKVSFEVF